MAQVTRCRPWLPVKEPDRRNAWLTLTVVIARLERWRSSAADGIVGVVGHSPAGVSLRRWLSWTCSPR